MQVSLNPVFTKMIVGQAPASRSRFREAAAGGVAAFIAVALGGSLWAALGGHGCHACHAANGMVGNLPLGWIGVGFYGLLLARLTLRGLNRTTGLAILLATGAHLTLVSVLGLMYATSHEFCRPCLLTGSAALLAGTAVLLSRTVRLRIGVPVILGTAVLSFAGLVVQQVRSGAQMDAMVTRTIVAVRQEGGTIGAGHAKVVIFERDGCGACEKFNATVLPGLKAKFGSQAEFEVRAATEGMPTPLVIALGSDGRQQVMVGFTEGFDQWSPSIGQVVGGAVAAPAVEKPATRPAAAGGPVGGVLNPLAMGMPRAGCTADRCMN